MRASDVLGYGNKRNRHSGFGEDRRKNEGGLGMVRETLKRLDNGQSR